MMSNFLNKNLFLMKPHYTCRMQEITVAESETPKVNVLSYNRLLPFLLKSNGQSFIRIS
jgi:hypothetical protein